MAHYVFGRFGVLMRDDHPIALYAGRKRLSPEPVVVWWWPITWFVFPLLLPIAAYQTIRDRIKRRRRQSNHPTKEESTE